jgi:putative oligomerization/nucleic acid binding protein
MFVRRRPLLRAAAIGGTAYMVGKTRAQHQAEGEQAQAAQAGEPGQPQPGQPQPGQPVQPGQAAPAATGGPGSAQAAPGGGPAGGPASAVTDQLSRLASLHQQGALTDAEFAAAKAKLLGT